MDEFVFPCREISVTFTGKFTCFAFASVLIICGGDVKQGTHSLVICLPHWQSPRHHPHLHWPHLQRGLWHFHLMLFTSGQIPCLRWLWIQLGTCHGIHYYCQIRNLSPMSPMSSNDSLLIHAQMLNSCQKRRSWTASGAEKGTWHICAWMESILRRKKWREDLPGDCFSISPNLFGCCGGRGGWTCPHCSGCTTMLYACQWVFPWDTVEDSPLQNVLGLPAAVERWSVCKIQAVKPQPGLGISFGCEPADDGWIALVHEVCRKEGSVSKRRSTISRLAHNGAPMSPVIWSIVIQMHSSCALIQPPALSRNASNLAS